MYTKEYLAHVAHLIIDYYFPDKWDIYKKEYLKISINSYYHYLNDGLTSEEAFFSFKEVTYEIGLAISR